MITARDIALVSLIVRIGFCLNGRPATLVSVDAFPKTDYKIFEMYIESITQCRYICIENNDCVTVAYESSPSICRGYKTTEKQVVAGDKYLVWNLQREGNTITLTWIICLSFCDYR